MPKNKNAMTRYQILDELLSNRYHDYSMGDLTDEVNRRLADMEEEPVTRRCIELDIKYLEYESPFMVEIERFRSTNYILTKTLLEESKAYDLCFCSNIYNIFYIFASNFKKLAWKILVE